MAKASPPASADLPDAEPAGRALVQVIARAAAILRALEGVPEGLSLGQIASRVGLARSTVQRIAGALEAEKLLIAASPTGRVRLGPGLLRLAGSIEGNSVVMLRPLIARVSAELGETVDLAHVRADHLVFIDQIVGSHRLRAVSAIGEAFPLYCTANGKAALARMEDAAIERLLGRRFPARTPHTHTTLAALLHDLREVRRSAVAIDREEHTLGICAAGIALLDPGGNTVAISVPVPVHRFADSEDRIVAALTRLKTEIESLMPPRQDSGSPTSKAR
jgi:DNA-binding IclR family transcriptional regulator